MLVAAVILVAGVFVGGYALGSPGPRASRDTQSGWWSYPPLTSEGRRPTARASSVSTATSTTSTIRATTHASTAVSDVDAVHFLSPSVGWFSADNQSRLLMTTDGGRHWVNISPPLLRLQGRTLAGGLSGGFFLSKSDFWVSVFNLGPDKVLPVEVLHTTNGGRSWTDSGSFPRDYGGAWLHFVSRSRGWLMVSHGAAADQEPVTLYETTTGGKRWSELARSSSTMAAGTPGAPSPGCDKTGISSSSHSSVWISGYCNGAVDLQHSRDGGRVWHERALRATNRTISWGGYAYPPTFFTPSDGVLQAGLGTKSGTYDAIYTTKDGGIRWTVHRPPTATEGPMDVLSATTWFVAHGHTLYVTTNGGTSWTSVRSSISLSGTGTDILDFLDATVGWTVTARGTLWHTTDGGRTWKPSSK